MTDIPRPPARAAMAWRLLATAVSEHARAHGRPVLDIVDVGGGTGGYAVPLAGEGHRVTVVDPSPDALATLQRRATGTSVGERVRGVQGDAADLADVLGAEVADVMLCHGVLEVVDDPAVALDGFRAVLRPGGVTSVLVAQRHAAVLSRAVTGHLDAALRALTSADGRWGDADPLPRRFDEATITGLMSSAGLLVRSVHGLRVFADLIGGDIADDPAEAEALLELEAAASSDPALRSIASQLHVLAESSQG